MFKPRGKILPRFLHVLLIAGILLINFSSYSSAIACDSNSGEKEECCCSFDCSSSDSNQVQYETITSYCHCIVEITEVKTISAAIHNSNSTVTKLSSHINFVKLNSLSEISNITTSKNFIRPPGEASYILKDVYLFNSILRI
ncbi:MAG: hypothetical protein J0M18_16425 [Ignavibacteria bacterium]|nr:hypothetical protein [Ignavibacteria bacterium]